MFFVNPPHIEDEAGEEDRSEGEDNEPINPLKSMSAQQDAGFYEAEMHGAIAEADPETCEDVMKEMEEWKPEIEKTYSQKLMSKAERNERKMDAKIDMLHQSEGAEQRPLRLMGMLFRPNRKSVFVRSQQPDPLYSNQAQDTMSDSSRRTGMSVGTSPQDSRRRQQKRVAFLPVSSWEVLCLFSTGSIQTMHTKYMAINNSQLCASNVTWSAFNVNVVRRPNDAPPINGVRPATSTDVTVRSSFLTLFNIATSSLVIRKWIRMPRDMVFLLSVSFLALRTLPPLSQEHQPELRRFTAEDTNNEGWNTSPRSCLHKLLGKPDFKTGPARIWWTIDGAHHPKLFADGALDSLDIKMGEHTVEGTSVSATTIESPLPDNDWLDGWNLTLTLSLDATETVVYTSNHFRISSSRYYGM
ncbi:hypothetical protein BD769DRAFT_1678731 [Suillus cothurnatus]|nr:hypothetical protein BD769DRAFT_1678731 [Suillus cothurnatus]